MTAADSDLISTMQTNPARSPLPRHTCAAVAVLFLVGQLAAQTAPAPKPVTAPGTGPALSEETVMLSPFQVASDADKGYQALNTLSGTRLNSKLEDLGASITVVTKQQMLDTAVLDINDVFRYEASTEGTDNFTTFNRNRSGASTTRCSRIPNSRTVSAASAPPVKARAEPTPPSVISGPTTPSRSTSTT